MAAGDSHIPFNDRDWLDRYFPLPAPHDAVRLRIRWPNLGMLDYVGTAEELVAAGVATLDMTLPGKKGTPRLDVFGQGFTRHKHHNGRLTIMRRPKSWQAALRMPGVAQQVRSWPGEYVCQGLIAMSQEEREAFSAEAGT